MEKVITAVVTTLLCSILSGEGQKAEVSKVEVKKSTQVETVKVENITEEKKTASFDLKETPNK